MPPVEPHKLPVRGILIPDIPEAAGKGLKTPERQSADFPRYPLDHLFREKGITGYTDQRQVNRKGSKYLQECKLV